MTALALQTIVIQSPDFHIWLPWFRIRGQNLLRNKGSCYFQLFAQSHKAALKTNNPTQWTLYKVSLQHGLQGALSAVFV